MAYGAVGTDTGGSVRMPAALTGTAALKVTTGVISTEGCFGVSHTLDSVGPMARTVSDLVLLFKLLQQTTALRSHPSTPRKELRRLRLGIDNSYYLNPKRMSPGCEKVMNSVLSDLESAGAELCPISLPSIAYAEGAQKAIVLAEVADYHSGELYAQRRNYGSILREDVLPVGDLVLAKDYLAAMRFRFALAREYAAAFEIVDFIVSPGVPFSAYPHGLKRIEWRDGSSDTLFDATWRTSFPSNLVGIPSLCQPCGLAEDGLPIGLQLIAPALHELDLLAVGIMLEEQFSWKFRPPLVGHST
jgi:aspartyl-tRNA(Asn)/glutamyl-tRNA(Gln) amidotransferase subunit A